VDLTEAPTELFNSFSSNTRYKIRRAEREGIACSAVITPSITDIDTFIQFFNTFAHLKKQPLCNREKLNGLREASSLILTIATDSQNAPLVAHAYIGDNSLGRLRLLYSASLFRSTQNSEARNKIGRANRLLHWHDMLIGREQRYCHYDLGGFPLDQSDPEKNAIARFKAEFGGKAVTEYNGFASRHRLIQHTMPTLQKLFV
jgi:lipid II:glycine glycyltransferase (peptidoglycan interpeptide bridge formation enzyme)